MKKLLASLFVFWFASSLMAQEYKENKDPEKEEHEIMYKSVLLGFIGSTHVIQSGINMVTFGMEYAYILTDPYKPHLSLGAIIEYEAGQHIVFKEDENGETIEINRANALLMLPNLSFVFKPVILAVGYGIELEKEENLGLLKVSLTFDLDLSNKHWTVVPTINWDHTKRYDAIVYGFAIGYKFSPQNKGKH